MKPALVAEARGEHARHLRLLQLLRRCHLAEEERSPLPPRLIEAKVLRGFQRHVLTPRLFWVSRQSFLKHEALDHRWVAEERLEKIRLRGFSTRLFTSPVSSGPGWRERSGPGGPGRSVSGVWTDPRLPAR